MKKSLLIASLLAVAAANAARAQLPEAISKADESDKPEASTSVQDNETLADSAD